jgi:hypothetical protein
MKIKIGNYTNYFGPYQLAEKLMFWVPKEKDEYGFPHTADRVHKFGEWLTHGEVRPEPEVGEITKWSDSQHHTWLSRFLSWIHSKQKRTVKIQIDPWDTWNMQDTLGYIIRPMLEQLKETKHGAPYVNPKDCPAELKPAKLSKKEKDEGATDSTHFERWDWVLDEMIFAFNTLPGGANEHWEDEFFEGEYDWQWKKLEDGNSQMVEGPNHTAKVDWDGRKKVEERIQNGFGLFGKYYQHLWD